MYNLTWRRCWIWSCSVLQLLYMMIQTAQTLYTILSLYMMIQDIVHYLVPVHDDTRLCSLSCPSVHDDTDVVYYLIPVYDNTDVVHYLVPVHDDTRRWTLSCPCTWGYRRCTISCPCTWWYKTLYIILPLYMMTQDVVDYLAPVHDDTRLCTLSCPRTWWYKTLYTILALFMMIQDCIHYLVPVHDDTRLCTLSCPCTWWYKTLYTILSLYMMIQEVVHFLALARCLNLVFQMFTLPPSPQNFIVEFRYYYPLLCLWNYCVLYHSSSLHREFHNNRAIK